MKYATEYPSHWYKLCASCIQPWIYARKGLQSSGPSFCRLFSSTQFQAIASGIWLEELLKECVNSSLYTGRSFLFLFPQPLCMALPDTMLLCTWCSGSMKTKGLCSGFAHLLHLGKQPDVPSEGQKTSIT